MLASVGESQVLTLVIPLGVFLAVCFWGFFQRRPSR
jgi:hypothetical protein